MNRVVGLGGGIGASRLWPVLAPRLPGEPDRGGEHGRGPVAARASHLPRSRHSPVRSRRLLMTLRRAGERLRQSRLAFPCGHGGPLGDSARLPAREGAEKTTHRVRNRPHLVILGGQAMINPSDLGPIGPGQDVLSQVRRIVRNREDKLRAHLSRRGGFQRRAGMTSAVQWQRAGPSAGIAAAPPGRGTYPAGRSPPRVLLYSQTHDREAAAPCTISIATMLRPRSKPKWRLPCSGTAQVEFIRPRNSCFANLSEHHPVTKCLHPVGGQLRVGG